MWRLGVLVFVGLCSLPVRSWAQATPGAPVYDLANHLVNTITSSQSVVTAIQTVLLVADSVTNLTGGSTVSTDNEYLEDIGLLVGLLGQAEGLSYDLQSLQAQLAALLMLDSAPDSMRGLRERLAELRRLRSAGYLYALRVQTLLQTTIRIARRILRIVQALSELIGNLSGHQNASDQIAQLNQTQATHNTTVTAFQRAQTVDGAEIPLIEESIEKINEQILLDWPGR